MSHNFTELIVFTNSIKQNEFKYIVELKEPILNVSYKIIQIKKNYYGNGFLKIINFLMGCPLSVEYVDKVKTSYGVYDLSYIGYNQFIQDGKVFSKYYIYLTVYNLKGINSRKFYFTEKSDVNKALEIINNKTIYEVKL